MIDEGVSFLDARSWALNAGRVRLDLYHMVTAIFASHEFELGTDSGPERFRMSDALYRLSRDFESAEIEHGLVSVAAMTRVLLDQISPRPASSRTQCGTLIADLSDPANSQPLTFREACNKVLHATTRSFATDELALLPQMRLTGSQLGRQWKADLLILPFASQVAELTEPERSVSPTEE